MHKRNAAAGLVLVRTLNSTSAPINPPVPQELCSDFTPQTVNSGEDSCKVDAIKKIAWRRVVYEPKEMDGEAEAEARLLDETSAPEYLKREYKDPLEERPGLDYKSLLKQSLRLRRPADLLRALVAAADDTEYIGGIPDITFSAIITLIRPMKLVEWANILHKNLTPHMVTNMGITPPDHIINNYLQAIIQVVVNRKKAGGLLNVNDYSALLGTASAARSKLVAKAFWESMISDKVTPDLRCYNSYLGAIVENSGNYAKQLFRVTEFHELARSEQNLGADFVDYRFGEGGIREDTLTVLDQILRSEVSPDAETFRLVILGVAREGDIAMVKGILKTTWGVDVSALIDNVDESYLSPRTNIPRDSPMRLREDVLYAVAHAFGINNDISTAFRVVDYMSRAFNIPISDKTWEELFDRTYVLAIPRFGKSRFKSTVGQIERDNVSKLWKTMISEAYNVQPTITMYDKMVKMSLHQRRPSDIWHYMQEGVVLYRRSRDRAHQSQAELEYAIAIHERQGVFSDTKINIYKRKAEFARYELLRKRDRTLVSRWCRALLFSTRLHYSRDRDQDWSTVQIPAILLKMSPYMPRVVEYDTPGGQVSIQFKRGMYALAERMIKATIEKEKLLNVAPMLPGPAMEVGRKSFRRIELRKGKVEEWREKVRMKMRTKMAMKKEKRSNAVPKLWDLTMEGKSQAT